jgi:hypothetical protein
VNRPCRQRQQHKQSQPIHTLPDHDFRLGSAEQEPASPFPSAPCQGRGGIELGSGGKQRCLIKALKAFSLAFSSLSCSVSLSISSLSFSICFVLSLLRSISLLSCFIRSSFRKMRCS